MLRAYELCLDKTYLKIRELGRNDYSFKTVARMSLWIKTVYSLSICNLQCCDDLDFAFLIPNSEMNGVKFDADELHIN